MRGASEGQGSVLYVEGHAGIGKSRLVEEAAQGGLEQGFDVLQAQGRELEAGFGFGLLLQLFHEPVRRASDEGDGALFSGAAALARSVLDGGGLPADEGQAFFRILHGLFWFLFNLSERRPALLCIDDAHLADSPSVAFLEYLAHRIGELPVVAIVAARPAEGGPAAELLGRLRSHAATGVERPEPLTRAGVERLMAAWGLPDAEPEFVEACREASGGYPLHLRELVLVLREAEIEATAANSARVREVGPRAVMEALRLSLRRLPPEATALARALAILGDDVPVRQAAELARLDERDAVALAAALSEAGILGDGERLAFEHPVVRAAVYQDLHPIERAFAHGEAARGLFAENASAERIAGHLLASEPIHEPWALESLQEAARLAGSRGDPASAARLYARAIDEAADPGERARLQIQLARAEAARGGDAAVEHIEAALSVLDEPEERAQALLLLGRALLQTGRHADAVAAFDRGLGEEGAADSTVQELRSGRFGAALWTPGFDLDTAGAAELESTAEPAVAAERVALANYSSTLMLRAEDPATVVRLASRAWGDGALLAETGPSEPALFAVTAAFTNTDELERSEAVCDAVIDVARGRGDVLSMATATYVRASVKVVRGQLAEAVADAELALDARRYGWGLYAPGAYWVLTHALLERGDVDAADRLLALPEDDERALASSSTYVAIHLARGRLALARGEAAQAVEELLEAGAICGQLGIANPALVPWRWGAVTALLQVGDRTRAQELVDDQARLAESYPTPRIRAEALRLRAAVTDEPEERAELLGRAGTILADSSALLDRVHVLAEHGSALLLAKRRDEAIERLRSALDLADRCGAAALAEQTRADLLAAGTKPRRARTSGVEALTPSELRVARLAAAGRTNREIAEQLFVTPKAVKWHLGNVYRKLDVSSREELPAVFDGR